LRPDLYDAAIGVGEPALRVSTDGLGAFAGPAFDEADIAAHLSVWGAAPQV
jgi:NitT/TauT family transport system ATP-binding protein